MLNPLLANSNTAIIIPPYKRYNTLCYFLTWHLPHYQYFLHHPLPLGLHFPPKKYPSLDLHPGFHQLESPMSLRLLFHSPLHLIHIHVFQCQGLNLSHLILVSKVNVKKCNYLDVRSTSFFCNYRYSLWHYIIPL